MVTEKRMVAMISVIDDMDPVEVLEPAPEYKKVMINDNKRTNMICKNILFIIYSYELLI